MISKHLLLGALLLAAAGRLAASGPGRNIVAVARLSPITVDGALSEADWSRAVPAGGFVQYDPAEGEPAVEPTTVRVVYDNDNIYFGIECFDSEPARIDRQLTRRDRTSRADRVSVTIDSYHDHETAFVFSVTASGVQSDGVFSADGLVYDVQWDAVWESATGTTPAGWTAEFRIPFSALRFSMQDGEYVWGVNFRRYVSRRNETDEWVMVPRAETQPGAISSVSRMGHLSGMSGISPSKHIEILPYQVSKFGHFAEPAPFPSRRDLTGALGLDVKIGLANDVTLDLALNPDFGQVEVDQAVLNLTVFETFFPEKRPFFLEGSSIFSFGNAFDGRDLKLFYSRRIGREPTLARPAPPGFAFDQNPRTTTIVGAAKLTGHSDDGSSWGVLAALTDEETAVEKDLSGATGRSFVVEPMAGYTVARYSKAVGAASRVGILATGAAKEFQSPAFGAGVDWRLRSADQSWLADGYLAASRPPAPPGTGGRQEGSAGRLALGRIGGDHLLLFSTYDYASRRFSIDDLGIFSRPRDHGGYTQFTWRETDAGTAAVRRYALTVQPTYRWNWEGAPTDLSLEAEPAFELTNFWTLTLNAMRRFPANDDASRGIAGLYRRPAGNTFRAIVDTDPSKPAAASAYLGFDTDTRGMREWIASLRLTLRVTSWMEYSPMVTLAKTRGEEAWAIPLYTPAGRNIFGDRDVDQADFSLRGTVAFSRSVTAQFFTQVFLAKGTYRNYRELLGPSTFAPLQEDPSAGSPDFNEKVLNANIVLRWEYLPGSTVYLVWTHERHGVVPTYGGSFEDDLAKTFKLPVNNVLLAKITYWWSH